MIIKDENEFDDVAAGCQNGDVDDDDDDDDDADDDDDDDADDDDDDEDDKQNQEVRRHALGLPRKKPVCVFIFLFSWRHPASVKLNLPMEFCITGTLATHTCQVVAGEREPFCLRVLNSTMLSFLLSACCKLSGRCRKQPADRWAGSEKVQHGLGSGAPGGRCDGGARDRSLWQMPAGSLTAASACITIISGKSFRRGWPRLGGHPRAGVASSRPKTNRIAASAPGAPPLWRLVEQQCGGKQKEALTSIVLAALWNAQS